MSIALFTGPEIVWRDAVQNKFFDALAAGKPVANNFRGWQAIVAEEAGAGLILDPRDVDAAARQLVARLRDPAWMAAASAAARRLGRERFDRDRLAAELLARLEAVAAA
jgi:glycosyltransferase involved in cell wall biosynthesis